MTWLAETLMLAHGWRRALLLLLAGALAGLSLPPLFVLPAIFLAFPVWVWALDGAEPARGWPGRMFGVPFRIGFMFGWGYFLVAFHWLGAAFFVDGGWFLALMPGAIAVLAAVIAVFWGLASAAAHLLWSHGPWRIVTLATMLTIAEWLRGHVLTGFPFDLLGYALTPTAEMMQAVSLVGIYGLTLATALLAMVPALVWPADRRSMSRRLLPVFLGLAAIAAQLGFGHNRLEGTPVTELADFRIRLVQPIVTEHADWANADPGTIIDRLIALTETRTGPEDAGLAGVDLIVWPESALPFYLELFPQSLARIARMVPDGTTLLTGAPRRPFDADPTAPPFNAILAIDTEGQIVASYDKAHLVPFGEFLPFQQLWSRLGIKQFVPGADGWQHGDARRRLMQIGDTPALLALICYEILFSGDLGDTAAAQYLFNITNDSWFDGSIGPGQHAHHARVRAVEEGMSLVRTANSGLTLVTDPLGRVVESLPPLQTGVLDVTPFERLASTPFAELRHWPLLGALLLGLVISLVASRRRRILPE